MSSHYITEPPPTASVLLHTTAGPIQISIFATQTPLASRNFLQHILDGYYNNTTFHRVVPGFVIQGGDPTGTGEGGESIYEDREFEIDAKTGEKVLFGDELHSRLRFNRRGLLGMAKMDESTYGSQFFITLADVRAQLDGKCTMFGRVEGDGIYNVVRIAEAENVEGTERPMYPFKITGAEVLEMPKGEPWASMKKRERIAKRTAPDHDENKVKKKAKTKNKGKALLSFGEDGDDDTGPTIRPKAKFNTSLIDSATNADVVSTNGHIRPKAEKNSNAVQEKQPEKTVNSRHPEQLTHEKKKPIHQRSSLTPPPRKSTQPLNRTSKSPETHRRKPSFHDPTTQLPLKDPESPSRSPTQSPPPPAHKTSSASTLNAEIAALKASMRRTISTAPENTRKKSALEQLIPQTSIRGRKRPKPGAVSNGNSSNNNDTDALKMLNAFKARLENADRASASASASSSRGKKTETNANGNGTKSNNKTHNANEADDEDEEATLCDLHFISNCQSCTNHHHDPDNPNSDADSDARGTDWLSHALTFEKDRLGKDLTWKRKTEEELVVIDPREKGREMGIEVGGGRDREWGGRGR